MYLSGTVGLGQFKVFINAYWITVESNDKSGKIVYRREATDNNWLDESHKRICNALEDLESAIAKGVLNEPNQP